MSKKTWNEVVSGLRPTLAKGTSSQRRLVDFLGIELQEELPYLVVTAMLRDHLAEVMTHPSPTEPSPRALAWIESWKEDRDGNIEPHSNAEAEAWGDHLRLLRRVEHLERTKIEAGDIVEIPSKDSFAEVSSIGEEGRVFFKGGYGAGSWPDLLTVRARWDDNSHDAELMREKARNCEARTARIGEWTEAKHRELADYETKDDATGDNIEQLERVIDAARDEKPIQKHLEENPHIITTLLGGRTRYCIPQKRLGSEYVPDFLICDSDSLGINWVLIELETPKSTIYLQTGDQLDRYARKGVRRSRTGESGYRLTSPMLATGVETMDWA